MSDWLQKKYIGIIGGSLPGFKWVGNNANFKCPYCGDSETNSRKARGYLLFRGRGYNYYCHNCYESKGFNRFLEEKFPYYYSEYNLERIKDDQVWKIDAPVKKTEPKKAKGDYASEGISNKAKEYLDGRLIPKSEQKRLYSAKNFRQHVLSLCDDADFQEKYKDLPTEERLIIPFHKRNGELFALQGRSLQPDAKLRYITIRIDENYPKLFGLERFNPSKPTIVTEGPIDSLFVPNAIAMAGADLSSEAAKLLVPAMTYVVYDNEPRNRAIIEKMLKAANAGFKVHVWQGIDENLKDINAMIEAGLTRRDIVKHIAENSYSDIRAIHVIRDWSKLSLTKTTTRKYGKEETLRH